MNPIHIFPLWFRSGVVLMIIAAVAFAAANSSFAPSNSPTTKLDRGVLVEQVSLFFTDQDNGDISIINAEHDQEIHRLTIGEGGFMRSVVRGLAHERLATGAGPEVPFQLAYWQSGLVSLIDPVTERVIELSAFGPDNVRAFTQLFQPVKNKS